MRGAVNNVFDRLSDPWLESPAGHRLQIGILFAVLALFVVAMVAMGVRDHRASERCEMLGGQTWDSGTHCVIGGQVVSTR